MSSLEALHDLRPSRIAPPGTWPVRRVNTSAGSVSWLVTGYNQACEMLRDARFSRSMLAATGKQSLAREMSITEMDSARHARFRRLVSHAYSARQVGQLRPVLEQKADALLSGVLRNGPVADLATAFAAPLAFAAQCEVLGVPAARRKELHARWLLRVRQAEARSSGLHQADLELREFVGELLADRASLSPGVFADLVAAHRERGLISEPEATGIALSFLLDGPVLAENQLTNAVVCLLAHPRQLDGLREDLAQLDRAIEELLRYCPASNMSLPRAATAVVALDTNLIRVGEVSRAVLPVANRDLAVIQAPDRLNLTRADAHHLTFGHGAHYCLGAHLTRMLMHVTFTAVLGKLREISLAVPRQDLRWHVTQNRRGLHELPITWRG